MVMGTNEKAGKPEPDAAPVEKSIDRRHEFGLEDRCDQMRQDANSQEPPEKRASERGLKETINLAAKCDRFQWRSFTRLGSVHRNIPNNGRHLEPQPVARTKAENVMPKNRSWGEEDRPGSGLTGYGQTNRKRPRPKTAPK